MPGCHMSWSELKFKNRTNETARFHFEVLTDSLDCVRSICFVSSGFFLSILRECVSHTKSIRAKHGSSPRIWKKQLHQTLMLTASVDPLGKFGSLELLARATLIVMAPPSVHRQNFQLTASAGGRAVLPLLALTAWWHSSYFQELLDAKLKVLADWIHNYHISSTPCPCPVWQHFFYRERWKIGLVCWDWKASSDTNLRI